jgi:Tol biopolymer transport system component
MRIIRWSVTIALLGALGWSAAPAAATFPGRNGRFAVELDGCEFTPFVRFVAVSGEDLGALTPPCEVVGQFDDEDVLRETSLYGWSPDGTRLLLRQSGATPQGIITIAADGTDVRSAPAPADATDASFAPDGRQIAYMRRGAIWRTSLQGGPRRRLRPALKCNIDVRDCVEFARPRWSPDGKLIAFEAQQFGWGPGGPPRIRPGIWLMSARTGKLIRRVARRGTEVDWSPDSRRLVYRTDYQQDEIKGGASGGNLWVVRVSGKGARRLVHRRRLAETVPTWSPDGRWIAWISMRFGRGDVGFDVKPSLWRVRAAGGAPRRIAGLPAPLVDEGDFLSPQLAWQPLRSVSISQRRRLAR